jgi:hypothetical protein
MASEGNFYRTSIQCTVYNFFLLSFSFDAEATTFCFFRFWKLHSLNMKLLALAQENGGCLQPS